jgi:hypothetical protein
MNRSLTTKTGQCHYAVLWRQHRETYQRGTPDRLIRGAIARQMINYPCGIPEG